MPVWTKQRCTRRRRRLATQTTAWLTSPPAASHRRGPPTAARVHAPPPSTSSRPRRSLAEGRQFQRTIIDNKCRHRPLVSPFKLVNRKAHSKMSNPASDEQLAALSSRLSSYPQSTTCEPGASPDMKRYLYAQQQLAAQGKARMRTWPKNSSTCCSHLQLTSHGLHTTTVLTSRSRAHAPAKQSYNPTDPSGTFLTPAAPAAHAPTPARGRCPHLQAQVAQLMTQIPQKYLTKQPILSGPGRNVEL